MVKLLSCWNRNFAVLFLVWGAWSFTTERWQRFSAPLRHMTTDWNPSVASLLLSFAAPPPSHFWRLETNGRERSEGANSIQLTGCPPKIAICVWGSFSCLKQASNNKDRGLLKPNFNECQSMCKTILGFFYNIYDLKTFIILKWAIGWHSVVFLIHPAMEETPIVHFIFYWTWVLPESQMKSRSWDVNLIMPDVTWGGDGVSHVTAQYLGQSDTERPEDY